MLVRPTLHLTFIGELIISGIGSQRKDCLGKLTLDSFLPLTDFENHHFHYESGRSVQGGHTGRYAGFNSSVVLSVKNPLDVSHVILRSK